MNDPVNKAWHKLDNAAKIFPSISRKSDAQVFRFSCELFTIIDEALLQSATEHTLDDFPSFQYVLKRGIFWYYMEQSDLIPTVKEEDSPPCSTRYLNKGTLLFNVTWYRKRINLEVYHALTDGAGALQFLKSLVLNYLKLAQPDAMKNVNFIDYDASYSQKMTDSFNKYYDKSKKKYKIKSPLSYQIKGPKETEWRLKIIEGIVSTRGLLDKAREYGATVTVFITALLMRAICEDMSIMDRKKPIVLSVPVNLRNYFESKSIFNFFSIVEIKYFYNNGDTLEDVIKAVKEEFSIQLNEEYLQSRLNTLLELERNFFARLVPLALKNLFMSAAYYISARTQTAAISNLGRVTMPEETKPYIRLFDVFTSTNKLQICMCSFEDNMKISFTSPFISTDIQRSFFRQLSSMGLSVEITANNLEKKQSSKLRGGTE